MSSAPTAEEIAQDARWLAQALDPNEGMVRLVAMDSASYRAASFLDDRLLQQPVDAQVVPWPNVEAAVAGHLRTDARWIFHIGHVGSTLVSRLLGQIDGVLAIREPRLLRDLALSPTEVREQYIQSIPKLMSRTFAAIEIACVKATSFASEIAPLLVPAGERALFMFAAPRNYIASILAGENSVKELSMLTEYRSKRLGSRGIMFPKARNTAEAAAAAWACEMVTLESAAAEMSDRAVSWADFDGMLADMTAGLAQTADFFGIDADREAVEAIASGPLMKLYSKDPAHDYSPTLRRDLIDQELRLQGGHIEGALAMLSAAAEKSPLLARALARAED
jgi:hypothetical protein